MMNKQNISVSSFRISAPYGEYSKVKNVLNIFLDNALKNKDLCIYGTGKREQNFTYAGDILQAIELAVEKNVKGTYEIVGQNNISMLELAKKIIEITDSKSNIVFTGKEDTQENYRPNYSFKIAFDDFQYFPKYSIEDGLKKYIEWYKTNENCTNI